MLLPNRNHHRLPILFPEFSSRFDVTTAGQMKEKWRQACRIPIYLSTPRRATFECIYAGMRVRSSFSTSSSFFFISFLSFFGWTSIYSPATRASNMNLLALVFLRDDRYSVRHRVKYESHRELETNVLWRPETSPLSFVFQRAYTAFSMIGTRVSCAVVVR